MRCVYAIFLLLPLFALKAQNEIIVGKRQSFLSDNKRQSTLDSLVDRTLRPFMQKPQNCGISIAIIENGKTVFYNYGETQRETRQLPSKATVYEIGSISATFCGLLLAKAIGEHKVDAEDDIRTYLPGNYSNLSFDKEPIRLKHLAAHTSGLPDLPDDIRRQPGFDSLNPYKSYSAKQVYSYLHTIKPATPPGDVCEYSNLGLAVLGLILENVYNISFDELVAEKICRPLGMSATGVHPSVPAYLEAKGYNYEGDETPSWELGAFAGAGGLRSTTSDLGVYLTAQLLEKEEAIRLSHQPVFTGRQTTSLGWLIKRTAQGNTLLWHSGATYGFSSFCGALKEKNSGVVILCNSLTSVDFIGIAILNYLQR